MLAEVEVLNLELLVIYYTRLDTGEIVLLVMYAKSERGSLSAKQLLEIRNAI